jgi:hypothetical protein
MGYAQGPRVLQWNTWWLLQTSSHQQRAAQDYILLPPACADSRAMDIFQALLQSHQRQRAICRRLLDGVGEHPQRAQALAELKLEMAAHETAEERAFYVPLIEHDATVDPARHGIAEHHEMDEMVEDLDKAAEGSAEWLETLGKLVHKVHHHLDEEEQKFFLQARQVLPREQQQELGTLYVQEHERLHEKEGQAG